MSLACALAGIPGAIAYRANLRGYVSLWPGHVLAGQFYGNTITGTVPFFRLNDLGGDDGGLRGYPRGRFVDKTMVNAQVEYRLERIWKRLGAVAFAGLGDLAARPEELALGQALYSYGLGLRFTIERQQKLNIRMDYALGEGYSGFYLTLGEAF